MKFIPERIRIVPLIVVLAVSPLVVLLYWMWRVRLKQNLRGVMQQARREVETERHNGTLWRPNAKAKLRRPS